MVEDGDDTIAKETGPPAVAKHPPKSRNTISSPELNLPASIANNAAPPLQVCSTAAEPIITEQFSSTRSSSDHPAVPPSHAAPLSGFVLSSTKRTADSPYFDSGSSAKAHKVSDDTNSPRSNFYSRREATRSNSPTSSFITDAPTRESMAPESPMSVNLRDHRSPSIDLSGLTTRPSGLSPTAVDRVRRNIINAGHKDGELVFPIAAGWLDAFLQYAAEPYAHNEPSVIDNSILFTTAFDCSFYVLRKDEFQTLIDGYGLADPKHAIPFPAFKDGTYDSIDRSKKPQEMEIILLNKLGDEKSMLVSPLLSSNGLYSAVKDLLGLDDGRFRLWTLDGNGSPLALIQPLSTTVDAIFNGSDQYRVGLEELGDDGSWPLESKADDDELPTVTDALNMDSQIYAAQPAPAPDVNASPPKPRETAAEKRARILRIQSGITDVEDEEDTKPKLLLPAPDPDSPTVKLRLSNASASSSATSYQKPTLSVPVGCTGLNNLGNTCFMNSALQCLSNTAPLTGFFLSGKWRDQLNKDNPLGMHGEVAEAYANLVSQLWRTNQYRTSSIAPRIFKSTIGRFNATFAGYAQQDSQELLQFLLDGLHEDLNRIKKKPYIEAPEMDGMPDHEIAAKSWEIYRARNDSAIVDLFQGEYKSRVECLTCGKWSIKFDPFMFLSLPVPERRELNREFVVVPAARFSSADETVQMDEIPRKVLVTVPRDANVKVLKTKVAELLNWSSKDPKRVAVMEIFGKKIYKVFQDWDRVAEIAANDMVYIYELAEPHWDDFGTPMEDRDFSKSVHIPLYLSTPLQETNSYYNRREDSLFGAPSLIPLPADIKVTVHVEDQNLNEGWLEQLCLGRLGLIMYRQAVRAIRRYARIKLYHLESDTAIHGQALATVYKTIMSNPEDADSRLQDLFENLSNRSVPFDTASTENNENVVPIRSLFSLKYYQGDMNARVGQDGMDNFYSQWGRSNSGFFYPPTPIQIPRPSQRREPSIEKDSSAQESEEDRDAEEESENGFDFLEECDAETPDCFSYSKTYSMRGELLSIAEFSKVMAELLFEKISSGYSSAIGGVFAAREVEVSANGSSSEDSSKAARTNITLRDCLNEFMREEEMGDEDTWYCPQCKDHKKIKKKLDVWRVPEILVFHLKRFSNSGRGFRSISANKIDALVEFPVTGLDLTDVALGKDFAKSYVKLGSTEGVEADNGELIYDLFGVSNHFGGLGGGHYTAYAKNPLSSEWYNFDDSHVSKVSEDSVMTSSAYLLFYQRRRAENKSDFSAIIEEVKEKTANDPAPNDSRGDPYSSFQNSSFPFSHLSGGGYPYGGTSYTYGSRSSYGQLAGPSINRNYNSRPASSPHTLNSPAPSGDEAIASEDELPGTGSSSAQYGLSAQSSPARLQRDLPAAAAMQRYHGSSAASAGFEFARLSDSDVETGGGRAGAGSRPRRRLHGQKLGSLLDDDDDLDADDDDSSAPVHDIVFDDGASLPSSGRAASPHSTPPRERGVLDFDEDVEANHRARRVPGADLEGDGEFVEKDPLLEYNGEEDMDLDSWQRPM
ncbi:hypothetical protein DFJ73DRAFT_659366 [Zopfochytrium polystomum]|nr:hypothetical protein DFJ73DRAFT_659366 [Zopfochytrium polystomum]